MSHGLQQFHQRHTVVPGHPFAAPDDVVALQRRQGMKRISVTSRPRQTRDVIAECSRTPSSEVDEVHLVDGDDDVLDAEQLAMKRGAASAEHAERASIEDDRQFAVDAPVAMLRVYCSWPGVSAMMNLRRRREVAVRDVDGDALLALGLQAVDEQRQVDLVRPCPHPRCPSHGRAGLRRSAWSRAAAAR
jgi:hypothetical protein